MYFDAAATPAPARSGRARFSFFLKIVLVLSLVAVADTLFRDTGGGSSLGLYAAMLAAAAALARPAILRNRQALAAYAVAFVFAVALFVEPSLLAAFLFWAALSMAVLLPRAAFDNGLRWGLRLGVQLAAAVILPFRDVGKARLARRWRARFSTGSKLHVLGLPIMGSLVFLALFVRANPVIADALTIDWSGIGEHLSAGRVALWLLAFVLAWSLVRPIMFRLGRTPALEEDVALPGVSLASVTLSLIAFNALFSLQNVLDIAFLWSGAPLPDGVTLADYAHRGAYPLIATAVLAGLFVLVTLRPGSHMAESRLVRRLLGIWIAQNVLLVGSTMLRTIDYVEAYSLTVLRISALLWMGLVALGLVLICWRVWRGKSGSWLINANMLAAAILLGGCAFIDLGAVAAAWNVRHAREAGGRGAALDLCYLNRLGPSALLPIIELESRPVAPALRERLGWMRNQKMRALRQQQGRWRTWTVLGARRLEAAQAAIDARGLPVFLPSQRGCDAAPPTLTAPAAR